MNLTLYRNNLLDFAKKFYILPQIHNSFKFIEDHVEELKGFHKYKLIGGFLIYVIRRDYLPVDISYVLDELSKHTMVKKKTFIQGFNDLNKIEPIEYDTNKHFEVFLDELIRYTEVEVDRELCKQIYKRMQTKSKLLVDVCCIYLAAETTKKVLIADVSDYYYIKTKYEIKYWNENVKKKRNEITEIMKELENNHDN